MSFSDQLKLQPDEHKGYNLVQIVHEISTTQVRLKKKVIVS